MNPVFAAVKTTFQVAFTRVLMPTYPWAVWRTLYAKNRGA